VGRTDPCAVYPRCTPRLPPCGHDGTERRIARPQEPTEQTRGYRGKKNGQTVPHVLLSKAALTLLLLRATSAGSTHDQRLAAATPYPWPAGSRWRQALGFMAFILNQVGTSRPTRTPRGRALTRAQKAANRRIARRRVRMEHVNRSVKRRRMVHDTCRVRKAGVRDLVRGICCGLHNFRIRLTPWQAMV
jgi:DDE superfamily endonuclease